MLVQVVVPHSRQNKALVSLYETAAGASLCTFEISKTFLVMTDKFLYFTEGPRANGAMIHFTVAEITFVNL